jgi:hypothetical protein
MYDLWVKSDSVVKLVTVNRIIRYLPSNDQLGWNKVRRLITQLQPTTEKLT